MIGRRGGFERHGLRSGAKRGLADGFGLEKIPGIGRLDIEGDAFRLSALAEHFGERKQEGHHRDQQRDLLVPPFPDGLSAAAAVSVFLMFDVMLDFMLDRVHAVTHVILRAFSADDLSNQLSFARGAPTYAFVTLADARCGRLP